MLEMSKDEIRNFLLQGTFTGKLGTINKNRTPFWKFDLIGTTIDIIDLIKEFKMTWTMFPKPEHVLKFLSNIITF